MDRRAVVTKEQEELACWRSYVAAVLLRGEKEMVIQEEERRMERILVHARASGLLGAFSSAAREVGLLNDEHVTNFFVEGLYKQFVCSVQPSYKYNKSTERMRTRLKVRHIMVLEWRGIAAISLDGKSVSHIFPCNIFSNEETFNNILEDMAKEQVGASPLDVKKTADGLIVPHSLLYA